MPFNKTAAFQQQILNHLRGVPMPAAPGALYVALCSADPGDAGSSATELPAGGGYARAAVTLGAPAANGATKHRVANDAAVNVGPFPAGVTVSHLMVCTGSARGVDDALYAGPIVDAGGTPTPTVVAAGQVFVIPVGSLTVDEG